METSSCTEVIAETAAAAELVIAFTDPDRLNRFIAAISADPHRDWPPISGLADAGLGFPAGTRRVSRVHFGNEFCERLLPSRSLLESVVKTVSAAGLGFSLIAPTLTDHGLDAAQQLLEALPNGSEVVVNDWGLMRRVRHGFPRLHLSAGRLLCRMLKEPRAPSAQYMEFGGHGFMSPGFEALLQRFGVSRLEIDVPPFATVEDLRAPDNQVSVHVPFGFTTTGRICRIGSLHQPPARKFATGHHCARECLSYATAMESAREPRGSGIRIFQRGNTVFYRHTPAMSAVVADAIAAGMVDRVIVSGDWNEAGSANLGA